jgi:hypothetical protein
MVKIYLDDYSLYERDEKNYLRSLEYAKKLESKNNEKLIFHCFWRVPREFTRKQLAVIKSIIVSHLHKLDYVEINLWSNVDLSEHSLLQDLKKYINFKIWDVTEEIKGTSLEDFKHVLVSDVIKDDLCWLEGDLFRLLILNKYGGFYIDMDTLVMRDMTPLNDFEFLYSWGAGLFPNEPKITMNGAVMRLNKKSQLSEEFLELIKVVPPGKNSFSWGNSLYSLVKKNDVLVFPCVWFDSEWGFDGTNCNPFKKVEDIKLFDGCFTWHWHNKWDEPIEIGSKFYIIEQEHDLIFHEFLKKNIE